jgi:RecJ-like exonuclease
MTESEAKAILSGKLIFGDAQQIEALRFLNGPKKETEIGADAPKVCAHCNDEGEIEEDCDKCDGTGMINEDCPYCDGTGEI